MTGDRVLTTDRVDHSLVLTIDREGAGNSLSAETAAAILDAIAPLSSSGNGASSEGIRSVIITGKGERFFCAGGDIKRYRALETAEQVETVFQGPRDTLDALESLPLPVIAAVNGYALGGGAELMLAADLRVAAAHARIGFPQSRLSIIPGWHGIQRLARDVGHARAMKLLLTGEMLSAQQAESLGLIHAIAEDESTAVEAALGASAFTRRQCTARRCGCEASAAFGEPPLR